MKKQFQIIIIAVLAIVILRILNGVIILNIGTTKIGTEGYPKFLLFVIGFIFITIYFIANFKMYSIISYQKHKYWKLFIFSFLIGLFSYLLFLLISLITFKHFPNYDPNYISSKSLGIPYIEPKFDPINELLIGPIIQLYYYIPEIKSFPLNVIMYFFGQPIFLSFVIPIVIIFLRNKKPQIITKFSSCPKDTR